LRRISAAILVDKEAHKAIDRKKARAERDSHAGRGSTWKSCSWQGVLEVFVKVRSGWADDAAC